MRLLGQNPMDTELNEMMHEVDKNEEKGTIEFSDFLSLMAKWLKGPPLEAELFSCPDQVSLEFGIIICNRVAVCTHSLTRTPHPTLEKATPRYGHGGGIDRSVQGPPGPASPVGMAGGLCKFVFHGSCAMAIMTCICRAALIA